MPHEEEVKLAYLYAALTLGDYITTFLGLSMGFKETHPWTLHPIVMSLRFLVFVTLAFTKWGRYIVATSCGVTVLTLVNNLNLILGVLR